MLPTPNSQLPTPNSQLQLMVATQNPPIASQTVLADRFISTAIERCTLVFPAVWVAEILRIDREQILDLPFYDPLLIGIVHHNGAIVPLVAGNRLLNIEQFGQRERAVVVRLNEAAGSVANIGIVVDRAIGTNNRTDLPPDLFTTTATDGAMLMMRPELIPPGLWQPRI
jgi:chemotaxis signal transduction protein